MKHRLHPGLLLLLLWHPASGTGLPDWVNPAAARAYAEAALIETASNSYASLDLTRLNSQPTILARTGTNGEKVVLVVYEASLGSYVVTLALDQDNLLRVFSRGARLDPPHKIISEFYDPSFDPSSLFQEG